MYLKLRLLVEKTLTAAGNFSVNDTPSLGKVIRKYFKDSKDVSQRVRLRSKKTLLNEFNHFEGNLSTFQPAIDITDTVMRREMEDIIEMMDEVRSQNS